MTMSSVPSAPSAGCSVLFCLAVLWVVWRSALSGMQKYGPDGGHMAAQKVSRLLRLFFFIRFSACSAVPRIRNRNLDMVWSGDF